MAEPTWYRLFTEVANGVFLQCVLLQSGIQTKGGHKTPYDLSHLRQVIERIPTFEEDDEDLRSFPIADHSLAEWVKILDYVHNNPSSPESLKTPTPAPEPEEVAATSDSAFAALKRRYDNKTEKELNEDQMNACQQRGSQEAIASGAQLSTLLQAAGIPSLNYFLATDFQEASIYPPRRMGPPLEWNPFLQRMAMCNIYGQLELMYERANQVRGGMVLLKENLETHITKLDDAKSRLAEQLGAIHTAEKMLNKTYTGARDLSLEVASLHTDVRKGLNNEVLRDYVQYQTTSMQTPIFNLPPTVSPAMTMHASKYSDLEKPRAN